MLISFEHQFLFVHNAKTAGCSVKKALAPYAHNGGRVWVNRWLRRVGIKVNHFGPPRWKRFRQHDSAATARRCLPPEMFDGFFKFAFVRNPWDWLVSYHNYVCQQPRHRHFRRFNGPDGFSVFLHWMAQRDNGFQTHLLTDRDGRVLVDFLGRYESLENDFAWICRRLGVEAELTHRNKSRHDDYRRYYDDASRDFVADRWQRDIELFGYTFDGPREAEPAELELEPTDEPIRRAA
jgi:hypothetical protein